MTEELQIANRLMEASEALRLATCPRKTSSGYATIT